MIIIHGNPDGKGRFQRKTLEYEHPAADRGCPMIQYAEDAVFRRPGGKESGRGSVRQLHWHQIARSPYPVPGPLLGGERNTALYYTKTRSSDTEVNKQVELVSVDEDSLLSTRGPRTELYCRHAFDRPNYLTSFGFESTSRHSWRRRHGSRETSADSTICRCGEAIRRTRVSTYYQIRAGKQRALKEISATSASCIIHSNKGRGIRSCCHANIHKYFLYSPVVEWMKHKISEQTS